MYTKKLESQFSSEAITLYPEEVGFDSDNPEHHHNVEMTKTHESGWTIIAEVHEDWYEWINDFNAIHPVYGKVWGNFEEEVYADSKEGFDHFVEHHPYNRWDYHDI
jgi:hypothetical protein